MVRESSISDDSQSERNTTREVSSKRKKCKGPAEVERPVELNTNRAGMVKQRK